MAARRTREWRRDYRRGRKRLPPPTRGWLKPELAALVYTRPSTISRYIKQRLIPAPVFRGTATRYQRIHLLSLLAIRSLRANGVTYIADLKKWLDRMTATELNAWVLGRSLPSNARKALMLDAELDAPAPVNPVLSSELPAVSAQHAAIAPALGAEQVRTSEARARTAETHATDEPLFLPRTWHEVQLLPGVILKWQPDVTAKAQHVARLVLTELRKLEG